jgi:hypothetical protein
MRLCSSQIVSNVSVVQIQTYNKAVSCNETVSNVKISTNRHQYVIGPSSVPAFVVTVSVK